MSAKPLVHAMTVDVEEYFQVSAFEPIFPREGWDALESRVVLGTRRLLDLFDKHTTHGTFFVLGWIAERHPGLVDEIRERGHEIASHGYEHRLVSSLDAEGFRADLRRAADAIRAACGVRVEGYRAPSFSMSRATPWAHEILRQEGYRWSSSVFPVRHDRYGVPDFPRRPVRLGGPDGTAIWEFPMTTWRVLGRNVPAAGGGWIRALPTFVPRKAVRAAEREGWPAITYVHPWEVDPDQPRVTTGSRASRFRHYLNLEKTLPRLDGLLARFAFGTVSEALAALPPDAGDMFGDWLAEPPPP